MVQYTIWSVPDPTDPPRKNKRAKRQEPDFTIDPSKPNATIELETADLMQLGQSGHVQAAIARTRELQTSDLQELREGAAVEDPKIIVDLGPDPEPPKAQNVFVDLGPAPAPVIAKPVAKLATPVNVQRVTPTMPKVEVAMPRVTTRQRAAQARAGMGLVVLVYVISTIALGASIYLRWFAA